MVAAEAVESLCCFDMTVFCRFELLPNGTRRIPWGANAGSNIHARR
jgi:hypothetical protein